LSHEIERFISPLQLARAIGVGESTVKRWIDQGRIAAQKTPGGHRRIPIAAAIAFVRTDGVALADPGALGLALAAEATPETLVELLVSEQPDRVIALFERLYATGTSGAALADDWIAPAMAAVGHGWEVGDVPVTSEHRGSGFVMRGLHALLRTQAPEPSAPEAVVATLSGDPYVLPGLCAELVLGEAGLRAVNFGVDTPLDSLEDAIAERAPRLVALSFSIASPALATARARASLRDAVARSGSALLVGGRSADEALVEALGATSWCRTMRDLERLAHHLVRSDPRGAPAARDAG
jgi:excisionase family DNA binding protein